MEKRPAIALCFSSLGLLVIAGVWFLVALAQGLSGMGSGGSTSGYISAPMIVVPFAAYFAASIVAALSEKRSVRMVCAIGAHSVPLVAMFASSRDWPYVACLMIFVFAGFAVAWYRLLIVPRSEKMPNKAVQPTTTSVTPPANVPKSE